ncbi:MAG: MmgE/PrpD family protein [Rhodobacter sp.]|nr:MmgE/PrpD family protein [Rhodobacter sp.]
MDTLEFLHSLRYTDLSPQIRTRAELCLLDLIGIAIGGTATGLSEIIRSHAAAQFGGRHPMLFDARPTSAAGLALSAGMTIDALDGHDGYNPAKGHVGCGLFPAALALALEAGRTDGAEFLTTIVVGYELGSRLGVGLHATAPDYHTSGAWVAVAAAAAGARLLRLGPDRTAHALGIAEYHGPRSQMMRCIDHPTMVKDGSGWGAMAGVSAALLARDGFTGAPALTIADPADLWSDLGVNWLIDKQYFKPYPVCRWAQAPVEAALALRRRHTLTAQDIAAIEVATFHESTRLATQEPKTTEEAQYSTSFPTAVALVRGAVTPADITGDALHDPEILRLSRAMTMTEDAGANARFPAYRPARVTLTLRDGTQLTSDWTEPRWDADNPPTEAALRAKFHDLADPLIGPARAARIESALSDLPKTGLQPLYDQLIQPISRDTTAARAS